MPKPKPQYSLGELAMNGMTVSAAMMRGGRLTGRQKRRLDRIKDNAQLRADKAAEK